MNLKNYKNKYDANCIYLIQAGNGCADNDWLMLDQLEQDDPFWDYQLDKWIILGNGDNPYRIFLTYKQI